MSKSSAKKMAKEGSALLLTVSIIAVLTVTTLGGIAVRFDQFLATAKLKDSEVAKSAAESGVELLNQKISTGTDLPTSTTAKVYDLSTSTQTNKDDSEISAFRPNPRKSLITIQKVKTSLPRCIAVGVVIPWTNDGTYLYANQTTSSPALMFHYANIVSDTNLGSLPDNASLDETAKQESISALTNMGHFYNPYAPNGSEESSPNYWTIKMGGPDDEFLTRKGTDSDSSYFKNLDIVYVPYLPRFVSSGLRDDYNNPGSFTNKTAEQIQTTFENVVKNNNFKMWIDASAETSYVQRYGFGDLFDDGTTQNDVSWAQPNLWNDSAETSDVGNLYTSSNLDAGDGASSTDWSAKSYAAYQNYPSNGWATTIHKGSRPMAFVKFTSSSGAANSNDFTEATSLTGALYGSVEGLRLNKLFSMTFYDAVTKQPIAFTGGSTAGVWNNASITKIDVGATATTIGVSFAAKLPAQADGSASGAAIDVSDVYIGVINSLTQYSATSSVDVNLTNATTATLTAASACTISATFSGCPAIGDIIGLSKGSERLWAKVTGANFSDGGTKLSSYNVAGFYQTPKPVRSMASVTYGSGASTTIAYYGGAININDYDGGLAAEVDELWLYQPEVGSGTWAYKNNGGTSPGKLAGASMVYDSANNRLILSGGYYHGLVNTTACGGGSVDYTKIYSCLVNNKNAIRVAKRLNADTYAYSLATSTWSKIGTVNPTALTTGVDYKVQVLATMGDRSGLEGWTWAAFIPSSGTFNPTVGSTNVYTVNSVAGLAIGDDVFLDGKTSSNASILTAWGKITNLDAATNQMTIIIYSFNKSATYTGIAYSFINIRVVARTVASASCQSSAGTTCSFGSQKPGYGIGDLVSLERFSGGNLAEYRFAYIKAIDASGTLTFTDTEPTGDNWSAAPTQAPSLSPTPRYGGQFSSDPRAATQNLSYLWQGSQKNLDINAKVADVWQFNSTTNAWSFKPTAQPTVASAESGYNLQLFHNRGGAMVYTSASTSGVNLEIVPDKDVVVDNGDGTQTTTKQWDNSKTWTLQLSDSTMIDRLTTNSKIVIERQDTLANTQASRQVFHGYVKDIADYNGTNFTVTHDSSYSGDSGLTTNSANLKVVVYYQIPFHTVYYVGGPGSSAYSAISRTATGFEIKVSSMTSSSLSILPNVGSTLIILKRDGTSNVWSSYTMTVTDRSYSSAGGDTFSFTAAEGQAVASPIPYSYNSNSLGSNGSSVTLKNTGTAVFVGTESIVTSGNSSWFLSSDVFADNPQWKIYVPDSATLYNGTRQYPLFRFGAAVGAIYYGSGESKVYSVGGSQGRYSSVWREEKMANDPNAGARPTWKSLKTSAQSAASLPELSGGVLSVYVDAGGATKAVYFGGKYKSEYSNLDYGVYNSGPARGSFVSTAQKAVDDNGTAGNYADDYYYAYMANTQSSETAQGFVNTVYSDFSASIDQASELKNSLGLVSGRVYSGNPTDASQAQVTTCSYIADLCGKVNNQPYGQSLLKLGTAGGNYLNSWTTTYMVIGAGSAFLQDDSKGNIILSGPTVHGRHISNRFDNDGYYPYQADSTRNFGSLAANFSSDKTIMLAGYSEIKDTTGNKLGGSLLVTPAGIARGWLSAATSSRGYSYIAGSEVDASYAKKASANANSYLTNIPDPEDIVFTFNAAKMLSSQNVYKVVGYYGSVRRGYLASTQSGAIKTTNLIEIVP